MGVFIQSWLLRQLQAGVRPGPDRGLVQDGYTDRQAYYTTSLLTEYNEIVLGQRLSAVRTISFFISLMPTVI